MKMKMVDDDNDVKADVEEREEKTEEENNPECDQLKVKAQQNAGRERPEGSKRVRLDWIPVWGQRHPQPPTTQGLSPGGGCARGQPEPGSPLNQRRRQRPERGRPGL